jgi:hypothetical protein
MPMKKKELPYTPSEEELYEERIAGRPEHDQPEFSHIHQSNECRSDCDQGKHKELV